MRQADNLREIAALGPDYFGFIFYPPSPRFVTAGQVAALPDFPSIRRVGVFVNETAQTILATARAARLSLVQLHGDETPELCAELAQTPQLQVIKAFAVGETFTGETLAKYETACDYFLFDTRARQRGGSGIAFDWSILRRMPVNRPFFLGGGVGPENAASAFEQCAGLPLHALDINSRVEIAPGVKSPAHVRETIEIVRSPAVRRKARGNPAPTG
jgi:phosphoribosylanthranilate isomerase